MRLLAVVPQSGVATEPWMDRMLKSFGPSLVGVVARRHFAEIRPGDPPRFPLFPPNLLYRGLPRAVRGYSPYRPAKLVRGAIQTARADAILVHYGNLAVQLQEVWDDLEIPVFVHFHGYDFTVDQLESDGSGRRVHPADYRDRLRKLSQKAQFIANSEFARRQLLAAGVTADRIQVNYLGVPVPESCPRQTDNPRPVIAQIGRFVDCKGPQLTLRAFERLRRMGVDAELWLPGDGPLREVTREQARASELSDSIHLPGNLDREEVAALLRRTDIFTTHNLRGPITGQEEALGVAIIEAMAAGIPVVGTRSGGVPETVTDGETGFIGTPGDIEYQAQSLFRLIRDPDLRSTMGSAGWARARDCFAEADSHRRLSAILQRSKWPDSDGNV